MAAKVKEEAQCTEQVEMRQFHYRISEHTSISMEQGIPVFHLGLDDVAEQLLPKINEATATATAEEV